MMAFHCLKADFLRLIYNFQKNNLYFSSTNAKVISPRKRKVTIKNTFSHQNKFLNNVQEDEVSGSKWVSSPLITADSKIVDRKSKADLSSSKHNVPTLKYTGEMLFGIHPVYLALLKQKRQFYQLFMRKEFATSDSANAEQRQSIIEMAEKLNIPIRLIDSRGLRYLTSGAVHQGVCLDAGSLPLLSWRNDMSEDQESGMPLWIILHEILDPMNVGAILRSAYYFGVTKLFYTRGNSCRLSPVVSKASAGCLEVADIYQIENVEDFIQSMKNRGWNIISAVTYQENDVLQTVTDVSKYRIVKPTILILGNEGEGIPSAIQKLCDFFISIFPKQVLHQGIDSLNVSVAAGVILHSLMQFNSDNG